MHPFFDCVHANPKLALLLCLDAISLSFLSRQTLLDAVSMFNKNNYCKLMRKLIEFTYLFWFFPSSVEICSSQITPVIPMNNTIWIHHGDNFKYTIISKILSFRWWSKKKINNSFHHQWTTCFTWMLTSKNYNSFSQWSFLSICASYCKHVTRVSCQCCTQCLLGNHSIQGWRESINQVRKFKTIQLLLSLFFILIFEWIDHDFV